MNRLLNITNIFCELTDAERMRFVDGGNFDAEGKIGIQSSKSQAVDYARAFGEIMIMHASDQLFHLSAISPLGNTGATIYDSDIDAVTFMIPGGAFGPLGLIAHEFKHGYQFLTGEIDLGVKGLDSYGYIFYDQIDEREAYDRGHLFGADYFSNEYIAAHYSYLKPYKSNSSLTIQDSILTDKHKDKFSSISKRFCQIFIVNGTSFKPIIR